MAQVKVIFYLPVRDNDGRDLADDRSDFEDRFYLQFPGWTKLGILQGAYRMADGTRMIDEHQSYAILVDEILVPEIEDLIRAFKAKTLQEAIYLEVQYNVEMRLL